jgi:small subunit ribosomal protein S9
LTEHPEDEQQADDQEPSAPEEPEAEEPVAEAEEPVAEPAEEPVAESVEEPVAAEPAEEPVAESVEEPAAAEEPVTESAEEPVAEAADEPEAEPEESPAEEPSAEHEEPAIAAEAEVGDPDAVQPEVTVEAGQNPLEDEELEEIDDTPRQKPEIPGADLIPDIVSPEQFLDAEAQAAAEADAEAAAAREREAEDDSSPIADAAIDLAAGARYTSTGKRKTAVARVILKPGTGTYVINGKTLEAFFPRETLRRIIRQPLETVGYESRMDVVARMHGGGVSAQAGALRHGISRALIVADPNLRGELKRRGFLTRDPRVKERKKAGLKKARKRPQFSKR